MPDSNKSVMSIILRLHCVTHHLTTIHYWIGVLWYC